MTRSIYQLGLCLSLATLAAACDDGSTSTTDGRGGNGGDGGTTATTSNTGSTTTNEGGGGQGGGGSSQGGGGSSQGGGGQGGGGSSQGGGGQGGGGSSQGGGGAGGGQGGAGGGEGGAGGGMKTPSELIADVRAADGMGLDLPITGAYVTYTKPELGLDAAGFFIQAEQAGPAIFVAIDPASLDPAPQVGDELSFTVNAVATNQGLKSITELTDAQLVTTGNDIEPLITDISMDADVVMNLDEYESRAIRITGDLTANFVGAGAPQVATPIVTMGLDDANLRLRMPEAIRAQYSLGAMCSVSVDYGVMWRFNAVAQPSVYSASDLTNMTCPAPTVVSGVPLSLTEVVITFDRALDPATVDVADFMFDNGLTATAVAVNGTAVTVTTSPQMPGTQYTVTVSDVADSIGGMIGMPNTAMFLGYTPVAQMILNEVNPNIGSSRDLIELLVTQSGSTNGITLSQKATNDEVVATFPDVLVAAGDLIVVHLNAATAAGAAPGSELMAKNQYAAAMFGANYDEAWDFHGGNVGLTNNHRVLQLDGPGGIIIDAVPFADDGNPNPPAGFLGDLQALQAAGLWLPADCGGALCDYMMSMPSAVEISVFYDGAGTTATGASIQRKPGMNTKQKSDWNTAAAHSWGLPNP